MLLQHRQVWGIHNLFRKAVAVFRQWNCFICQYSYLFVCVRNGLVLQRPWLQFSLTHFINFPIHSLYIYIHIHTSLINDKKYKLVNAACLTEQKNLKMQQNCWFWYSSEILRPHTSFDLSSLATLALGTLKFGKSEWTLGNTLVMELCRAQATLQACCFNLQPDQR